MIGTRIASGMAVLFLAAMSWGSCPAGESAGSAGLRPTPGRSAESILPHGPDTASGRIATPPGEAVRAADNAGSAAPPAVSLDRRVPAAQPHDREGLSLVGVLGAVGELRHAFTGDREAGGDGLVRLVRMLRDSVLRKRVSILSESGRLSESEPYLVGLSFTH